MPVSASAVESGKPPIAKKFAAFLRLGFIKRRYLLAKKRGMAVALMVGGNRFDGFAV